MPGHVRALKTNGKVRKPADGSTIWQARWRPAGDPSDRNRRERVFRTKREAERWITRQDSDVLTGSYVDPQKSSLTLASLADEIRAVWIAKGLAPKTRAGYEAILRWWIIGGVQPDFHPLHPGQPCRFHDARVGSITTKECQDFVNDVRSIRAPNTTRRVFGVLSSLLKLAARRGYIAVNPCDAVEFPTARRAGVRRSYVYLEGHELRALAEALPEPWRLPVYIAGTCGLRAGELWALRRRDVDVLHREITVRYAMTEVNNSAESLRDDKGLEVGPPKSAAARRRLKIPDGLVPALRDALADPGEPSQHGYAVARERPKDRDYADLGWTDDPSDPDRLLFTTPVLLPPRNPNGERRGGYPIRHNRFYKKVFKVAIVGDPDNADPAKRREPALPARLHGLRFHDLRHTAATLALADGAPLAMIKERLGHEQISTTADLYGKWVPSADTEIADAIGRRVFASASNVTALRQ
ncbi:MAG: tyrosine-type recombinase/integrase [Solirubrobacteraceae bacterium]